MKGARWLTRVVLVVAAGGWAFADATLPKAKAGPERPDLPGQMIERIERDAEDVFTGKHFTYDPAGRRDPFEPLIRRRAAAEDARKRPRGIAGMLVSEIDLKGIVIDTRGEPVAMFKGSDNLGYTLRVGDLVYDGHVLAIDPARGVVVFRQKVDDPRRIKPYRDVLKRLRPDEDDIDPLEEDGE